MARDKIVNKSNVKDPPEFKVGKWYKCEWAGFSLLIEGKYYLCQGKGNGGFTNGGVSYGDSCFDVNSECDYNPASRGTPENIINAVNHVHEGIAGYSVEKVIEREVENTKLIADFVVGGFNEVLNEYLERQTVNFNQQGESKMTNRKIVNVTLIDNDPALDVQYSLVAQFDNLVTEDSTDVLIQEILMNPEFDVAGKIKEHNETRSKQVDLAIEKNTGNSVKLKPVKLKQLTWSVK